jgi:hypothetical protein
VAAFVNRSNAIKHFKPSKRLGLDPRRLRLLLPVNTAPEGSIDVIV